MSRYYTRARRHPWVLGKVGDFKLILGPYTPAQIVVGAVGAVLLGATTSWWTWMGPLPLVGWVVAIWVVRSPRIAGRAPLPAAVGWLSLAAQPASGRLRGRAARDARPTALFGGFGIEGLEPVTSRPVRRAASSVRGSGRGGGERRVRLPRRDRRPGPAAVVRSPAVERLLVQAAARREGGS
ncbi:hypothetical protein AB0454_38470 [Streptomyces sp. NPDC093509]|uniref:hypothetical protein n=1 Tax=Streptomyces sp. NPDC093509 TaxID=3154982 RepID=UPI00344C613A